MNGYRATRFERRPVAGDVSAAQRVSLRPPGHMNSVGRHDSKAGTPIGKPFTRILDDRFRDELQDPSGLRGVVDAHFSIETWRIDYNHRRLRRSRGNQILCESGALVSARLLGRVAVLRAAEARRCAPL